jgi:hypothetical protein
MVWSNFAFEEIMHSRNDTPEPYEPPTIEDIPVRAEEQLLANCKTPTHGGPQQPSFPNCGPCQGPLGS